MWCRGIRGATTVDDNSKESILAGTRELLAKMVAANEINVDDVACAILTTTSDLNAEFPAVAVRQMGWNHAALLCSHEMDVPGSLQRCVRILLLCNTGKGAGEIVHVYMKGASELRSDVPRVK